MGVQPDEIKREDSSPKSAPNLAQKVPSTVEGSTRVSVFFVDGSPKRSLDSSWDSDHETIASTGVSLSSAATLSSSASGHITKKQKINLRGFVRATPFSNDLSQDRSQVHLTRFRLSDLDGRNFQRFSQSHLPEPSETFRPAQSAGEYLCHYGTEALEDVKQLARHGGPDLSDLRGFGLPASAPSTYKSSTDDKPAPRATRPYTGNFRRILINDGIYPEGYVDSDGQALPKPDNWEDIHQRLSRPRASLAPSMFSDEAFQQFTQAHANATDEWRVSRYVIPTIEGNTAGHHIAGETRFKNLAPVGAHKLVPGQPDIYHGAHPDQLFPRVRTELNTTVVPSKQRTRPIVPNYFVEVKGPGGAEEVANNQACHDGALGARGMHSLQSYGCGEPVVDNNACTIASTYVGGSLRMFTTHPLPPTGQDGRREYAMHQLNGWQMTGNVEAFRQGATYYRNGRDWAREQRDEAIRVANERSRMSAAVKSPVGADEGQSCGSMPRYEVGEDRDPIKRED